MVIIMCKKTFYIVHQFLHKKPDRSAELQEILVDFNFNEPSRDAWNALGGWLHGEISARAGISARLLTY